MKTKNSRPCTRHSTHWGKLALITGRNTAGRTAPLFVLLSEWPFSGRKYRRADSSAVRIAVRKAFQRAKIQQGRQQCGASCCQEGLPEDENTAGQTAVRCGLLSERLPRGQKYSSIDSIAVRPAVRSSTSVNYRLSSRGARSFSICGGPHLLQSSASSGMSTSNDASTAAAKTSSSKLFLSNMKQ